MTSAFHGACEEVFAQRRAKFIATGAPVGPLDLADEWREAYRQEHQEAVNQKLEAAQLRVERDLLRAQVADLVQRCATQLPREALDALSASITAQFDARFASLGTLLATKIEHGRESTVSQRHPVGTGDCQPAQSRRVPRRAHGGQPRPVGRDRGKPAQP